MRDGTPLSRIAAVARYAESKGYNPLSARGPEGWLFDRIEALEDALRHVRDRSGSLEAATSMAGQALRAKP